MGTKVNLNVFDKARTALVVEEPWWGSLALRLKIKPGSSVGTAATDGNWLVYCPEFFASISARRRITVIAHEVMHCALSHFSRRSSRNPELWNIATDHVINLELKDSGFEPMEGFSWQGRPFQWVCDPRFKGMSAEQVYAILEKEQMERRAAGKEPGQGQSMPMPGTEWDFGHIQDAGPATPDKPLSPEQLSEDWKIAVQEATEVARKAGRLPRGLQRIADNAKQSRTDWREVLRRWISVVGDYAWTRPNRRFIHQGIYIPGCIKTRMASLVFVVDTSGSINGEMLAMAAAELESIFETEARPAVMQVLYHDTEVHGAHEVGETLEFNPKGGGGTAFQPTLDYIAEQGLNPDCVIWFTDLQTFDTPEAPEYPVLFLVPEYYADQTFPFGEIVPLTRY